VLPIANVSADREQDDLSDGIAQDIITDLSKVSALSVVARSTAFAPIGQPLDIQQVEQAKQLALRVRAIDPESPGIDLNLASAMALPGPSEIALDFLETCFSKVGAATFMIWTRRDTDLVSLRDLPRFRRLLADLEDRGAANEAAPTRCPPQCARPCGHDGATAPVGGYQRPFRSFSKISDPFRAGGFCAATLVSRTSRSGRPFRRTPVMTDNSTHQKSLSYPAVFTSVLRFLLRSRRKSQSDTCHARAHLLKDIGPFRPHDVGPLPSPSRLW
jgi:hypothetical protein